MKKVHVTQNVIFIMPLVHVLWLVDELEFFSCCVFAFFFREMPLPNLRLALEIKKNIF